MVEIEIEYIRFRRKTEKLTLGLDERELNLSNSRIRDINLDGLAECDNLEILDLSNNNLENIDLLPLSSCRALREVDLSGNELLRLKTEPLRPCSELQSLNLSENSMRDVELDVLTGCNKLTHLNISSNHIHELDLSPLSYCGNLVHLDASNNQLERVDIAPLSGCQYLSILKLNKNWIRYLDFDPLSECSFLKEIDISENPLEQVDLSGLSSCGLIENIQMGWTQLTELDLSPLSTCTNLRSLNLESNKISQLDLKSLSSCSSLEYLNVNENPIDELDVLPLFGCPNIARVVTPKKTRLKSLCLSTCTRWPTGLDPHRKKIQHPNLERVVQNDGWKKFIEETEIAYQNQSALGKYFIRIAILEALGLQYLRVFDGDLFSILQKLIGNNYIEIVKQAHEYVIEGIHTQVKEGGTTLYLDLSAVSHIPELAVLTPQVLELRRKEIEETSVIILDQTVDIRNLWLTSYAHDVLCALEMGPEIELENLESLQKKMKSVGFTLKIEYEQSVGTSIRISEELRAYVLFSAELNKEK
ncbi:MAG: leucine-rich repeat protein [Candidatus Thorarchaeota archaeon]